MTESAKTLHRDEIPRDRAAVTKIIERGNTGAQNRRSVDEAEPVGNSRSERRRGEGARSSFYVAAFATLIATVRKPILLANWIPR